jgi:hypothetical protein
MTTWWHHPTILNLRFDRRLALRVSCILLLCIALITTLFLNVVAYAAPGVNQTIGFQGRLLDANGDIVKDGYYNMQFKIYQDGSGTTAGNPDGTLKWTETYINNGNTNGAVEVKNGFLSVNLGSLTPFGTSVDWGQDTLWLSMNVAGASTSCTAFGSGSCAADGEMLPMKRMTATPYSLNSAQLGGVDASGYIRSSTTTQNGDINISGVAKATTLQGNTSVLTPMLDSVTNGTLNIGTVNAETINIGRANDANTTINIGTGEGSKTLILGTTANASFTALQGGSAGVRINTKGGFSIHDVDANYNPFEMNSDGSTFKIGNNDTFVVKSAVSNNTFLSITEAGNIITNSEAIFTADGAATFNKGITIQGSTSTTKYITPNGAALNTAINIPNYTLGAYSSVLAFGIPSESAATARGMLIADGRTGNHQATIGVLSPDENAIMGLSWNGSNSTGTLSNTASSLALQGGGLNLLTATNNGGIANVGIGNSAAAGYALDVTGDINTSTTLRINGVSTLTNASLNFSAASTASVSSASGQLLNVDGKAGVNIQSNGTTVATFGSTNIQIGDGASTGTPTLLTVDKGTSAPTVDSSMLGSMYYDTTIGKLQCYEADGWGACSANPDTFVTLSPEYSNAVIHSEGTGTMTTDICSDELNINDGSSSQPTICGTNETYNYYNWTSSSNSTQTRSIYVTYKLPSNFGNFVPGSTSLMGRTDSADSSVSYKIYRNTSTGLVGCGTGSVVSNGAQTLWQTKDAAGQEPANCGFTAGDSVLFKINLDAHLDANAYAGNLNFAFKNNSN